jgi:SOS-response transcriptional repressor LexA
MNNNVLIENMNARFVYVRKYMAMTGIEFANALGIAATIVSSIETGKREPSKDVLIRLAEKFGVNLHWLITGEGEMLVNAPKPEPEKPDIKEAISCLVEERMAPKLSDIESRMARLEALAAGREEPPAPILYEAKRAEKLFAAEAEPECGEDSESVAFVDNVAAGPPIYQSEDISYISVPKRFIKAKAEDYYAARIRGGSMAEAGIPDGCVALFRVSDAPRDGAIQIVERRGESTVKRMREAPGEGWRICYEDGTGRYIEAGPGDEFQIQGDFVAVLPESRRPIPI